MGGRYRHPDEMLADLTAEQWFGWLDCFTQDPWDEQRKDDRNAVNALWSIAPYAGEDHTPPGFNGPSYKSETEENAGESWERLKALKKKIIDGKLNSKTSDPANH